jgi:hypothetical protein
MGKQQSGGDGQDGEPGGPGSDAQAQAGRNEANVRVPGQGGPQGAPAGGPGGSAGAGTAAGTSAGTAGAAGGAGAAAGGVGIAIQVLDGLNNAVQGASDQIGNGGSRQ